MNTTGALLFKEASLEDRSVIEKYMYRWGEGSCQHSFPAMYLLSHKYGDSFCERDGYLYVLRSKLCRDGERVYLFPMGDRHDANGLRRALENVLEDAHAYGGKVRFESLTREAAELCQLLLPGRFEARADRDLAEYIYTFERLAYQRGPEMHSRRQGVSTFFNQFGDRTRIERICPENLRDVRSFQAFWSHSGQSPEDAEHMEIENTSIQKALEHFDELGLKGIVMYVDGACAGYAYGAALSPKHYDVIIEKGDRRITNIYRALNREHVRACAGGFTYINREEDLGVEGLRRAKLMDKPDILLEKYIVTEV